LKMTTDNIFSGLKCWILAVQSPPGSGDSFSEFGADVYQVEPHATLGRIAYKCTAS